METGPRFIVPSDGLEKPGSESVTLVYKASDITTALQRILYLRKIQNEFQLLQMTLMYVFVTLNLNTSLFIV